MNFKKLIIGVSLLGTLNGAVYACEIPEGMEKSPVSSSAASKARTVAKYAGNGLAAWGTLNFGATVVWDYGGRYKANKFMEILDKRIKEEDTQGRKLFSVMRILYDLLNDACIGDLVYFTQVALVLAGEGLAYMAGGKEATLSYKTYTQGKKVISMAYVQGKKLLSSKEASPQA